MPYNVTMKHQNKIIFGSYSKFTLLPSSYIKVHVIHFRFNEYIQWNWCWICVY